MLLGEARTCQLRFLASRGVARLQSMQAQASAPMSSPRRAPLQLSHDSRASHKTDTSTQRKQQLLSIQYTAGRLRASSSNLCLDKQRNYTPA